MKELNDQEFHNALTSSYQKKYEEALSFWFTRDAAGNVNLVIPEDMDEKSSPAEVLSAIKKLIAHEAFDFAINDVIKYSRVPLDILREYAEYLNWDVVATKQVLDEEFIEEFINELDLQKVLMYQDISDEFMKKYVKKAKIKNQDKDKKHKFQDIGTLITQLNGNTLQIRENMFGNEGGIFYTNSATSARLTSSNEDSSLAKELPAQKHTHSNPLKYTKLSDLKDRSLKKFGYNKKGS